MKKFSRYNVQLVFNSFIIPTKQIHKKATNINGLSRCNKQLFQHGIEVPGRPANIVFLNLFEYLHKIGKKCVLVAHNSPFDNRRLIHYAEKLSITEEFKKSIIGFTDTLSLFRKRDPKRANGYKLWVLVKELLTETFNGAHDALADITALEKLAIKKLAVEDLLRVEKTIDDILEALASRKNIKQNLSLYQPMVNILNEDMRKRLESFGITYNDIVEKFKTSDEQETILFLRGECDGKIIKSKPIMNKILQYLKSKYSLELSVTESIYKTSNLAKGNIRV